MPKIQTKTIEVRLVTPDELPHMQAHLTRHFAESGRNGFHFFPFAPDDPKGPSGIDVHKCLFPIGQPHWQRWFMALDTQTGQVCGHLDLHGPALQTSAHRCVLGIGIEEGYRTLGLGKRLMETAIEFVREIESIQWLDLMVFAHNAPARKLYTALGFEEIGYTKDLFRIGAVSIDDVSMTLNVATQTR